MKDLIDSVRNVSPVRVHGKVTQIVGLVVEGYCPRASVGTLCELIPLEGNEAILAEVVGFKDSLALLMPLGELQGLGVGSLIRVLNTSAHLKVGRPMLGRVLDAMGKPLDDQEIPEVTDSVPIYSLPPGPMERQQIKEPLDLGIRAINGLLTCGTGQRMGIMSGSGVGKSILMGMMARNTQADVNVIALIGERGREVREFVEQDLGDEGLSRSVVIAATSDQSPLLRMRGAFAATAVAEYFSSQGLKVLLMMDSVTRFALAMREIGLAIGEPPTTKGYTPSVFAKLPKLLERAGSFSQKGSITGLYTVLVEADDMNEPIADSVRSILDGHIVLSRRLALKNHYPSIDILQSASRIMRSIVDSEHLELAGKFREILATYNESEDLINIGAYSRGSNPKIDYSLDHIDQVQAFLRQDMHEKVNFEQTMQQMKQIFQQQVS